MVSKLETLQSYIPGPVSAGGSYVVQQSEKRPVPYDGTLLTSFLNENGGDPTAVTELLQLNQIGDPDADLYLGRLLYIPTPANQMFTFNAN